MSRATSLFLTLLTVCVAASTAQAQGIPAVSGVLKHKVSKTVIEGTPPTLTLTVSDRDAAFYAKCTYGSPAQDIVAESEALEAGEPFVLVLPADTSARSAECAVVARFANGLSERKAVRMQWEVVPPPTEEEDAPDAPETSVTGGPSLGVGSTTTSAPKETETGGESPPPAPSEEPDAEGDGGGPP